MKNNIVIGIGIVTATIGIVNSFIADTGKLKLDKNIANLINTLVIALGGAITLFGLSRKLEPEEYNEPDDFEEF